MDVELRPLTAEDVPATYAMARGAMSAMAAQWEGGPFPEQTPEQAALAQTRYTHLIGTDPDGCWVAVEDGAPVGVALSLRRGEMWFLSLLAVAQDRQSRGTGKRLLEAALQTADDCAWLLASPDPRALRRYALAGMAPRPAYVAKGAVDRAALPADLAVVTSDWDRHGGLVDDVVTGLRGAPYGPDQAQYRHVGTRLLVVDEPGRRGWCAWWEHGIASLGATDPATAQRLLWAVLAELPGEVEVEWLTADQAWAVEVVLAARLPLLAGPSVCARSPRGPLAPYLPNGAYG